MVAVSEPRRLGIALSLAAFAPPLAVAQQVPCRFDGADRQIEAAALRVSVSSGAELLRHVLVPREALRVTPTTQVGVGQVEVVGPLAFEGTVSSLVIQPGAPLSFAGGILVLSPRMVRGIRAVHLDAATGMVVGEVRWGWNVLPTSAPCATSMLTDEESWLTVHREDDPPVPTDTGTYVIRHPDRPIHFRPGDASMLGHRPLHSRPGGGATLSLSMAESLRFSIADTARGWVQVRYGWSDGSRIQGWLPRGDVFQAMGTGSGQGYGAGARRGLNERRSAMPMMQICPGPAYRGAGRLRAGTGIRAQTESAPWARVTADVVATTELCGERDVWVTVSDINGWDGAWGYVRRSEIDLELSHQNAARK